MLKRKVHNNIYKKEAYLNYKRITSAFIFLTFLQACTTYEVRTTDRQTVDSLPTETPDEYLLDVAIEVLDPDLDGVPDDSLLFSRVREAESIWVAHQLKSTIEDTNVWGAVRVVPDNEVIMNLKINGKILLSDGETLKLDIKAEDLSGKIWIDKQYERSISKYAYDDTQREYEPFQAVYNDIAEDLLAYLSRMSLNDRENLRAITSIKFAQSFSPEAFDSYLVEDEKGNQNILRLPAENDPFFSRIQDMQARDHLFVDVLQDYYQGFASNMEEPYKEWRSQSYRETQIIQDLEKSSRNRRIAGWLAIIGGVAAQFDDSGYTQAAGSIAIYGGVEELRASFTLKDEASIHIETLSEIGQSIDEELAPSVVELKDRSITLTGSVRNQYDEWREILKEMYYLETGYPRPQQDQEPNTANKEQ